MSKGAFGEITLSEAIDRLMKVREEGTFLISFLPCYDLKEYDKEFREALDTVLSFVECAVCVLSQSSLCGGDEKK